jgi:hypothetical protein
VPTEDEVAYGEVSVTEVVLKVRCKSDQKDELRALITSKGAEVKKGGVVDQVAAYAPPPVVGGMSPASKESLRELDKGMKALIQGQTGAQKTLSNMCDQVGKLNTSTASLKKRLLMLEKSDAAAKKRKQVVVELDKDEDDEEEEEEEEQGEATRGALS